MNVLPKFQINIKQTLFNLDQPKVMGILNVSPDSFFDGGKYNSIPTALAQLEKMIENGLDILDIGAVSTRPGSALISEEEEKSRLLPILKEIVKNFSDLIISIDTYRAEICKQSVDMGAAIINDISGGSIDPLMFKTVGELKVPYILTHIQNLPSNMQDNPQYTDVIHEIIRYFAEKIQQAYQEGIHDIIIDPGFGFGKTQKQNYELLKNLKEFELLECPILVGLSRKSMFWKLLETSPEHALNATSVGNTIALLNGANILRVHDVKEASECIKIIDFYKN